MRPAISFLCTALLVTASPALTAQAAQPVRPAPSTQAQRPAPAVPRQNVDLELVIATDNSGSIDQSEARLQRLGIAAAFRSPEVQRAIQQGALGRIAVAYLDWSSEPYTRVTMDWRVIRDKATADAFATDLLKSPPPWGNGTAIGEALALAAEMLEGNAFDAPRRTIDVSGDGPYNRGRPVSFMRDEIVAQGITINGLPIITYDYGNGDWGIYYPEIDQYYLNCVVGGPGAFALPAHGFEDFGVAVRRKLVLEISGIVPEMQHASLSGMIRIAAPPRELPRPIQPLRPPNAADRAAARQNCNSGFQNF
jgi:hypothetical protein